MTELIHILFYVLVLPTVVVIGYILAFVFIGVLGLLLDKLSKWLEGASREPSGHLGDEELDQIPAPKPVYGFKGGELGWYDPRDTEVCVVMSNGRGGATQ